MDPITMNEIEMWTFLAMFLPWVVARIIRPGMSSEARRTVAIVVYAVYGLFGAALAGQFAALDWTSVRSVAISIMTVIIIGYTSYQTLYKLVPWGEQPHGEPDDA